MYIHDQLHSDRKDLELTPPPIKGSAEVRWLLVNGFARGVGAEWQGIGRGQSGDGEIKDGRVKS